MKASVGRAQKFVGSSGKKQGEGKFKLRDILRLFEKRIKSCSVNKKGGSINKRVGLKMKGYAFWL